MNLSARSALDPKHVPEWTVFRIKRPQVRHAVVCKQVERFHDDIK